MGKLGLTLLVLLIVVVAVGAVALMTVDIPAPSKPVEKVLPDAQFPR